MKKLTFVLAVVGALAVVTAATAAAPTVTLQQDRSTIIYGGLVKLNGQVTPAAQNQSVTIQQMPQGQGTISTTYSTNADGTFAINVSPRVNERVSASANGATSDELQIFVRPRVSISKFARHRFVVRVVAARPFVGRYVWITRWSSRAHAWKNFVRVQLAHYVQASGASTAAVRLNVRRGTKLRVFLNDVAARPDYIRGWSNFVVG